MAYSDFTLNRVRDELGITIEYRSDVFAANPGIEPSALLLDMLAEFVPLGLAINSEKARSEFIIAPILAEVRRQLKSTISLFSGKDFSVDAEKGLTGRCDFLLSTTPDLMQITAPVVTIVEARNEDVIGGLGQCMAEMVAAQIFNQKAHQNIPVIYGVVTSGSVWRFLRLDQSTITIDLTEYYIDRVEKILGVLIGSIQTSMSH